MSTHVSHLLRRWCAAGVATLLVGAAAATAGAQQRAPRPTAITSDDPTVAPHPVNQKRSFSLFGKNDAAFSGMKTVGSFGFCLTNYGTIAADGYAICQDAGHVLKDGAWNSKYFESPLIIGAPKSEFRKIRNLYPAAAANVQSGYSFLWNQPLFANRPEIGPADNTIAVLFSGVASTADGSCRDMSAPRDGYVGAGFTLLAGSDCPETWPKDASGNRVFYGPRFIPDTAFLAQARGNPDFQFDDWKIPENQKDQSGFLGKFSTYGAMSDYHDGVVKLYGGITPRGTGAATIDGFPMGLDMHFEAYDFALPAVANAVYYRLLVVNRSADLYGAPGVDYDSLYLGMETGWYDPVQSPNTYYVAARNAVLSANIAIHDACNGARVISGTASCYSPPQGFNYGATGIIFLKSPIGDTRNKLLSREGPFKNLASTHVGDTITFNHGHKCGYSTCDGITMRLNDRRGFGMISSTGNNVLEADTPDALLSNAAALTNAQHWRIFRNYDFPNRTGKFNAFVPGGNWDYNHDGVLDTLHYDSCDQSINNQLNKAKGEDTHCVSTWSDSLPGGFVNSLGNVGGVISAGPFKLKAGDTTEFVFAFVGAPDSLGLEAITKSATDFYLNFYQGPTAPPSPEVLTTVVGTTKKGKPYVDITISDTASHWVDPYLTKFIGDLQVLPQYSNIIALNPNLIADLTARASNNFQQVLVFKSCDGGVTFTVPGNNCRPAPLVTSGGSAIGNGYRPYAVIRANADGSLPTQVFHDEEVSPGRTYLYSFVSQSRGFSVSVLDKDADGNTIATTLTVADSLVGAVATSGPSTKTVYIPISYASGAQQASATVSRSGSISTFPLTVNLTPSAKTGNYTVDFANKFVVVTTHYASNNTDTTVVTVSDTLPAAQVGADTNLVTSINTTTYTTAGKIGLPSGVGTTTTEVLPNGNTVTTTVIEEFGYIVLAVPTGAAKSTRLVRYSATSAPSPLQPLYIAVGPNTPSSFLGSTLFPGFTIDVNPASLAAGDLVPDSKRLIKPPHDTLPQTTGSVAALYAVQVLQPAKATLTSGTYQFTFQDDSYGPNAPFVLDIKNPDAAQAAITASLNARKVAATGATDDATRALIAAANSAYNVELVAAKFPFTVTNTTFNRPGTLAMFKRSANLANNGKTAATANTILLGNPAGVDTLRVTVPEDVWVPGDLFAVIEQVEVDSMTAGGRVVLDANKNPIKVTHPQVTLLPAQLGCSTGGVQCVPLQIGTKGAVGYLPLPAGSIVEASWETPFDIFSVANIAVVAPTYQNAFSGEERAKIRVVPNPYIVQSAYDQLANNGVGTSRVYFTHMPAKGSMRIYSVSGQFLQALSWSEADLNGTGDLPYNLRTREGTDLSSGLYIYVIRGLDASGKEQLARGKFVVIR
ncbi:MAG TPA: hypothetical protein VFJ74_05680 [Gemmatimonadaceae bacterium]|nr:hypothetical protein [Gemmatimonadaceae bacterium]